MNREEVKLSDPDLDMIVDLVNDSPVAIEKDRYNVDVTKNFFLSLDKKIVIGRCACCGGSSGVYFHGNVIGFSCSSTDSTKCCKYRDKGCPGIDECVNKEDYDPGFREKKKVIVLSIAMEMFKIYDVVIIEIDKETREIVADHFLKHAEYITRTIDNDVPENPDFFRIMKNARIIDNKAARQKRHGKATRDAGQVSTP